MTIRSLVAATCGLLIACGSVPEAPEDISSATSFLFQHLDHEEESVVVSGILSLEKATAHLELTADVERRAFKPPPLTEMDLGTAKTPADQDPNDQYRVAVAGLSRHLIPTHRKLVIQTDLLPIEADDTPLHTRMPITPNPQCFVDDTCRMIHTKDELRKDNFLFNILYKLDYQARVVEDETGRLLMVERAWMAEIGVGEDSSKTIDQQFRLLVWWPDPDGKSTRMFSVVWMTLGVFGATEGIFVDTVRPEVDDSFGLIDDFLDTL